MDFTNPLFRRIDLYNLAVLKKLRGHELVRVYGMTQVDQGAPVPISSADVYQTPTEAVALEIVSASADDGPTGPGLRTVKVEGLDANWEFQEEEVALNGITPVALTKQWVRVFELRGLTSGTYGSFAAPNSQAGVVTLRGAGAGATWATIPILETDFGFSRSQIGFYTVPKGFTCVLISGFVRVDTRKNADVFVYVREKANQVAAPFKPMELGESAIAVIEAGSIGNNYPIAQLEEYSELGFVGRAEANNTDISVGLTLLKIENKYLE